MRGKNVKMLRKLFLASCALQGIEPTKSAWNYYKRQVKRHARLHS
jgi:hypothetical protein